MQAAGDILHDKGYHNASLSEVAKQLGMTDGALYYYFKSKADLACECILGGQNRVTALLDEADGLDGKGLDKVEHFVRRAVRAIAAREIWIPSGLPYWIPSNRRREILAVARKNLASLATLLEGGVADKSISWCEPTATAMLISGSLFFLRSWAPFAGRAGTTPETLADSAAAFISRSLAGGGPLPGAGRQK